MLTIQTKTMGDVTIDERQVIKFPAGLIGFEDFTDYALLDAPQKPYFYLQSLQSPDLNFILLDPFLFRPDYSIDAPEEYTTQLGIKTPEDALVLVLVTVPPGGGTVTANLMGPLLISRTTRLGIQLVLADNRWTVKHDILAELAAIKKD